MGCSLAGPRRLGDVRANVEAIGEDARRALDDLATMARQWLSGEAPFRERGPTNAVWCGSSPICTAPSPSGPKWAHASLEQIQAGGESAMALADEVYAGIAETA
jgi:hypothetical protein